MLLTFFMVILVGYHIIFLLLNGYLDRPFFYDKSDTFMDFFSTEYWSFHEERYTDWGSIYTPFSFLLTQLMSCDFSNSAENPFLLRQLDFNCFVLSEFLVFFIILYHVYKRYKNLFILSLVLFSAPLLFAFERGNLLIFLLPLIFLFVESKSNLIKGILLGLAISLKIYLFSILFVFFLLKNFRVLLVSILSFFLINSISSLLINASDWLLFVENIIKFSEDPKFYEWSYFTYSYRNILLGFAEFYPKAAAWLFGVDYLILGMVLITFLLSSLYFMKLSSVAKDNKSSFFILLLLMLIMIVVRNAGGYVFILLFPFILPYIRLSFVKLLLFSLVIPFGYTIYELKSNSIFLSYFSGEEVNFVLSIDTGMIIRPFVFLFLYFYLSVRFITGNNRDAV